MRARTRPPVRRCGAALALAIMALAGCGRHSRTVGPYLELSSNANGVILLDTINTRVLDADHAYAVMRYEPKVATRLKGVEHGAAAILSSQNVDCTTNTAVIETMTALDSSDQVLTQLGPQAGPPDRSHDLQASGSTICAFIRRHARDSGT
jgi:hypothetical protein